ncbi:MAG: DUF308 domain-containing protein [Prevotellaceae bacterium]|jgi:uncharacterized membrane protein HdeD (DUF308 family)|nr:DUF308 domain-containing protein [Prevotellaceae bacterium]
METIIKSTGKTNFFVQGLVFCCLGVALILFPDILTDILSIIIAVAFFIIGISAVWSYIQQRKETGKKQWYLIAAAIVIVALGVCLLVFPDFLKILLAVGAGVWMLIRSVQIIGAAITLKSFGMIDWAWFILVGLLTLLMAVILLAFPATVTEWMVRLLGIALLLIGIYYFFIFSESKRTTITAQENTSKENT